MVAEEPSQFSQRLRRLREAAGLTQEELAERAGLSVKAIGALERGQRQRPYPQTVRAIAAALGLSDDERAELAGSTPKRERAVVGAGGYQPRLPMPPSPLIGREREITEITSALRSDTLRMLTLTGAGGVGKTRLALEVASLARTAFSGRVAFVQLAPLSDPGLVLPTIAQELGLTESGTIGVREMLVTNLGNHPRLLVLDNFEHVLDAAVELAELLSACPELSLLVTSRAPLKLRAEQEYPVRPLAIPSDRSDPAADDVAHVSSVRLFVARARGVAPDFQLTPANTAAVATICQRLDGLPLALELVAARVRILSPTELLARFDNLLPLLSGGSRDLPQRQQTMQAAVNWSYQLLNPAEQALFRRLSVFAGGWILEAAEAVTTTDEIAAGEIVNLLSVLVEQSLVVAEGSSLETTRYRMLEPIRQFAASRVKELGEATHLFDAHFAWALSLAQRAEPELRGPDQPHWLDRLEQEHDNLRAALEWSVEDASRNARGLELAAAIWRFWETRGHPTEGRQWLERLLSIGDELPAALRAEGLNAAGNLARDQAHYAESVLHHEASLALRRDLGDKHGIAMSLNNLANVIGDLGDYARATAMYEEALALFREFANDWEIAIALHNVGIGLGFLGDYQRANAFLEEALPLWERLGDTAHLARSLDARGEVARKQADLTRAWRLHEEGLALRQQVGDSRGVAVSLKNLGLVALNRGDYLEATRLLEDALQRRERIGDKYGIAVSYSALAEIARREGDADRAARLYRDSITLRQQMGTTEGIADCLLGLAAIAASDDPLRAARLLGASDALREATKQSLPPVDRADYDRTVAAIRSDLPAGDYAQAMEAGRALSLAEAVSEAFSDDSSAR